MSNDKKRMGRPPIHDEAMTRVIPCRFSTDTLEQLDRVAKDRGESRNKIIRTFVEDGIKREDAKSRKR